VKNLALCTACPASQSTACIEIIEQTLREREVPYRVAQDASAKSFHDKKVNIFYV